MIYEIILANASDYSRQLRVEPLVVPHISACDIKIVGDWGLVACPVLFLISTIDRGCTPLIRLLVGGVTSGMKPGEKSKSLLFVLQDVLRRITPTSDTATNSWVTYVYQFLSWLYFLHYTPPYYLWYYADNTHQRGVPCCLSVLLALGFNGLEVTS